MNAALWRWMGIKPEDRRKLAMLVPVFFLCAVSEILNYNGYYALFNQRLGTSYLPYMYAAEAVILPFEAWLLSWLSGRLRKPRLMRVLFAGMGAIVALNALVLLILRLTGTEAPAFYAVLFLGSSFVVRQQTILLWSLAIDLCPTQQAKRLMPSFVSSAALGGIAAGVIAQLVSGVWGADAVYMLAPVFLLAGSVNYWRAISRYLVPLTLATPASALGETGDGASSLTYFKKMVTWPYLLTATLVMTLMPALYFLMEYEFLLTAGAVYTTEAEFASFLGLVTTWLFALALALQLGMGRITAWLGPSNILLAIAVVFAGGFVLLVSALGAAGALFAASFVYMLGYLLLYYVAEPANQMYFKLLPILSRDGYRFAVSGVSASAGIMLGAALQWLHGGWGMEQRQLAWIGLGGAVSLVLLTIAGRRLYIRELIRSVQTMTNAEPDMAALLAEFAGQPQFRSVLSGLLRQPNDYTREVVLEWMGRSRDSSYTPELLALLDDPGARIRAAALRALDLSEAGAGTVREAARALSDPDYEVRREAVRALERTGREYRLAADYVRPLLKDGQPEIIAAAVKALYKLEDEPSRADAAETVMRLLREGGEPVIAVCEMLAESGLGGYESELERLLRDESPAVREAAIASLGTLRHTASIPRLLELLEQAEPGLHETTVRALQRMGPAAWASLHAALPRLQPMAWSAVIRALTKLGDEQSCRDALVPEAIRALRELWSGRELTGAVQSAGGGLTTLALMRLRELRRFALEGAWAVMERVADEATAQAVRVASEDDDEELRESGLEVLAEGLGDKRLSAALLEAVSGWEDSAPVTPEQASDVLRRAAEFERDPWLRAIAAAALQPRREVDQVNESRPLLGLLDKMVFLKQVPFFSALSLEELGRVAGIAEERFHRIGDYLFRQGAANDTLGVIIEGALNICASDASGRERQITVLKRKYVYGESSSLYGTLATASGVAATDPLHILAIRGSELHRLIRLYPGIGIGILRTAFDRIRRLEHAIADTPAADR
ncbi:HEAT repeat-containing protein [Paenibacillus sp. UNCCL117]|uniref:HEAT repeat domain-containing protein n=1 Tax=unclassified Paenibacillus TaxID=185978 RepID=UPI00087E0623|nr:MULTISPECIES: HEAT repeat domain-containing protein [unclassified Paenibacillus]SDE18772.1 HEAT repeat-containing protein [Paenibacillus sp. cl123]SFW62147.1 HEAT repeat-containing protein [Paenibacillus sp. UNCCL117]